MNKDKNKSIKNQNKKSANEKKENIISYCYKVKDRIENQV